MLISLVVLPGTGQRDLRVSEGATLADVARSEGLESRQLCINGQTVPRSAWGSTVLSEQGGRVEVAALAGSKGN